MTDSSPDRLELAQRVLEDYLARRDRGEAVTLETLIAEHPDLAAELRELHAVFSQVPKALSADARAEADSHAALAEQFASFTKQSLAERYEIQGEIGRGGMGAIYRVIDKKFDRPLAMKVILGQATAVPTGKTPSVRPQQLARFLNEAKITSHLDHPGIVPVHELGLDPDGRAFFTMKLVKGITLAEVFTKHESGDASWPTPRVLGVIERVCEAMSFAHERGVIHRDLKPANVMVGDFGEVYVMDWGLARASEREELGGATAAAVDEELGAQVSLTADGAVVGTPAYMSPEQARGELANVGARSDVYSIGAMLYQLVAGAPPYVKKGEKLSGAQILARVVTGPPAKLEVRDMPPELIAICERAMAYERDRRYATVRELADDLRRFVSGRTEIGRASCRERVS
jgi:serine/threonine-protein kinase